MTLPSIIRKLPTAAELPTRRQAQTRRPTDEFSPSLQADYNETSSAEAKEYEMLAGPVGTLVSDFDGTLTRHDFFRLAVEHLMPAGVPDYWQEYREGRMTHFEAMQAYYGAI